ASAQDASGVARPFVSPSQSSGTGVPTHSQSALSTSLIVAGLPSSQTVPGRALPPGVPLQSSGWPTQLQFAFQVSLPVFTLPSSQAVPGVAGPPTWPMQSGDADPEAVACTPNERSKYLPVLEVCSLTARTMYCFPFTKGTAGLLKFV